MSVTAIASSSDGTKLFASSESQLYTSSNSGVNWTSCSTGSTLNLTWRSIASSSDGNKLVACNDIELFTSSNSGVNWTKQSTIISTITDIVYVKIASSSDGTRLCLCTYDGYIYTSTNSGVSFTERTSLELPRSINDQWKSLASSSDGTKLFAASSALQFSSNSGLSFNVV